MSVLQVQNVVKFFGNLRAVDDVSFALEHGDNLAIIGESGCGKTTLAKMIMGLTIPDTGFVKSEANNLQMVFQDPNGSLDPLWNVREILKEALWRDHFLTARQVQERLEGMLLAVGLSPCVLQRFPHEFSGGERQRIAIARALLASCKVLVLDEAVSALDTLVQKQIIDLLKKLKQDFNLTYIFISHNLRLVRNFSDKIIVMYQGKIVEQGRTQAVLQSPSHPYTQQLLEAAFYPKEKL
ncbi:MAG: ABC transporter ATP-binding protein [Candidatus Omnitrophica bacterium]|nr:ABC transporter ATP-binding protein [Candidatus Omnitrophota bacterium]